MARFGICRDSGISRLCQLALECVIFWPEASALPVEERAAIVDSLLRTLNAPDPAIEALWIGVAAKRLADLESGKISGIPISEVAEQARKRYS